MDERIINGIKYFTRRLDAIEEKIKIIDHKLDELLDVKKPIPSEKDDMKCPKCGMPLANRTAKKSGKRFLGCTGWKPDNAGCNYTKW